MNNNNINNIKRSQHINPKAQSKEDTGKCPDCELSYDKTIDRDSLNKDANALYAKSMIKPSKMSPADFPPVTRASVEEDLELFGILSSFRNELVNISLEKGLSEDMANRKADMVLATMLRNADTQFRAQN